MNARAAARVAYSAGEPTPISTRRWALIAGAGGVAANLLLVLFFALAQPWRWPDGDLAWLGPANDVAVVVQFLALVPVAVAVRERLGAARFAGIARFGWRVAASFLTGLGVGAAALLLPSGSAVQFAGFGLAVLIGLPGWLGFPVWSLLVARLFGEEET